VASGCGADPALKNAQQTLSLSSRAAAGASSDAQAHAALEPAVGDVEARLEEGEHAVDLWQETGSGKMAWLTVAACLGTALGRLAEAYRAAELAVPTVVEEAQTMAESASGPECRE